MFASIAGDEGHLNPSWAVFDVCASGDDWTVPSGHGYRIYLYVVIKGYMYKAASTFQFQKH